MADNTFLGLQPYTEDDAYRFKGRTEESQELFRLIVRNDFTVCYAESGEGKTSLLNAGVFPLLRENMYFPIAITFTSDDYQVTPDSFDTIIDRCIKDSIAEYNEKNKGVNVEYTLCSTDFQGLASQAELQQELSKYSWWKLRNYKPQAMGLTFTPAFVFDQFEEVFNMPGSIVWTKKLFDWLEDVSSDSCPDEVAQKVRGIIGDKAAFPTIKEEKGFKAVFSLRKEFIGELDYWGMQTHFIPALKDNRYCLKALTYEGAKKVMTQQKRFDENKVEQILTYFVSQYSREPEKTIDEGLPVIPALLLSVVCDSWEKDMAAFAELSTAEIGQSLNSVLERFYNQAIDTIVQELSEQAPSANPEQQCRHDLDTAVFALIDSNGKRVRTKTTNASLTQINFDGKYKQALSRHRIIKVTKIDGEDYVEIVHDSLCPIIAARRDMRLAAEAKERGERLLREQAKKNKKRMLLLSSIIVIALVIIGFFYYQNSMIQKSKNELEIKQRSLMAANIQIDKSRDSLISINIALNNTLNQLKLAQDSLFISNRLAVLNERKAISNLFYAEQSEAEAILSNANSLISNGQLIDAATTIEHLVDNYNSKYSDRIKSSVLITLRNLYYAYNYGGQYDKFIAHNGQVCDMCFNSDGSMIATSSNDQTIRIWSTKTGQLIKEYPLDSYVLDVWSSKSLNNFFKTTDNGKPISKSCYKTYSSVSVGSNVKVRNEVNMPSIYSKNTVLSPDGTWALSEKNGYILVFKGEELKTTVKLEDGESIEYMEFAFDNSRFLLYGTKGFINPYVKEFLVNGKQLKYVDFSKDGYVSTHGCIYLPKTHDMLYIEYKEGPLTIKENGSVATYYGNMHTQVIAINPISNTIAFGGRDGSLILQHYEQTPSYKSASQIDSLFFETEMRRYDDGMTIEDGHIRDSYQGISLKSLYDKVYIIDEKRNTEIALVGHQNNIGNVIFNRTHDMVITRAFDNTIRFWSVKTGKEIDSLRIRVKGYGNQSIACSPDNRYLVSSSDDMLYVWEIRTGSVVFSTPYEEVDYSCFSKDGKKILFTSGFDNKKNGIKVVVFPTDEELINWFKKEMPKRKK